MSGLPVSCVSTAKPAFASESAAGRPTVLYQFTLQVPDTAELYAGSEKLRGELARLPGIDAMSITDLANARIRN